jgi:hypothetical protein
MRLDQDPTALTKDGLAGIQAMVNALYTPYLERRGKSRWCDKSLTTFQHTDLLCRIFEKAKFLCLYRHAMDMMNSGLEASPWGLNGYGFEPYAVGSLNLLAGLANYWLNTTTLMLKFEESHPDKCRRVYYEQLAAEPEAVMNSVFKFLEVPPLPGIAALALSAHEPNPSDIGDHKITTARKITARSVGRGMRVPVNHVPPGTRDAMNALLGRLGYTEVNQAWQMSTVPPPLLLPAPSSQSPAPADPADDSEPAGCGSSDVTAEAPGDESFRVIDEEIKGRFARFAAELPDSLSEWKSMAVVAYSLAPPRTAVAWRIDRIAGVIDSDLDDVDFESLDVDWVFTGELEVWRMVLDGMESLASALCRGFIRCVISDVTAADSGGKAEKVPPLSYRLRAVMYLLGLDAGFEEPQPG